MAEVITVKNGWARFRQGRYSIEGVSWEYPQRDGVRGDSLVELPGKRRLLTAFREQNQVCARAV